MLQNKEKYIKKCFSFQIIRYVMVYADRRVKKKQKKKLISL